MTAQVVSKLAQFLRTGLKEGATIAGERIEREALRAGVKPEELQFAKLPIDPNKRYTQAELSTLNRERDDIIGDFVQAPRGAGISDGPARYPSIVLGRVEGSPNYRERVTQFSKSSDIKDARATKEKIAEYWKKYNAAPQEEKEAIRKEAYSKGIPTYGFTAPTVDDAIAMFDDDVMAGRYMSAHFEGAPNYLMHTRYTDDALQGKSTRLLMEIQSDLHQGERVGDVVGLDASPWKSSWLRKGIERELVDAHNKGIEQVAIPISPGVTLTPAARELFEKARTAYAESSEQLDELAKWHAKQTVLKAIMHSDNATKSYVLGTAKEAGIQLDPDLPLDALLEQVRNASHSLSKEAEEVYELYRHKRKAYDDIQSQLRKESPELAHKLDNSDAADPDFDAPIEEWARPAGPGELRRLMRGEGVQKWYETEVRDTAKKIAKATGSEFEEVVDDGVKYAVIRPTKDFNVTLYSSPVAAYFGVRTALDNGYSEEEIRAYAKDKGIDADKALSAAAKIEAARKAGYSEDEIKAYLAKQEL